MPIYNAYYERQKNDVLWDTWGHFEPIPQRKYDLKMLFCLSESGDITLIRTNDDFPIGPFSSQELYDWVCKATDKVERGTVHLFTGYYVRFKNGRYRITGETKEVKLDFES